jgi:hypothetical protein
MGEHIELRTEHYGEAEWRCKCGLCKEEVEHHMNSGFMAKVEQLQDLYGKNLSIVEAYHCLSHPEEVRKAAPSVYSQGVAVDLFVNDDSEAYQVQKLAYSLGFTGISHAGWYVHLDLRSTTPVSWLY